MKIVTEMKIIDVPVSRAEFNVMNVVAAGALTGLTSSQIHCAKKSTAYGAAPYVFAVENGFTLEVDEDLDKILQQSFVIGRQMVDLNCKLTRLQESLGKRIKFLFTGRL